MTIIQTKEDNDNLKKIIRETNAGNKTLTKEIVNPNHTLLKQNDPKNQGHEKEREFEMKNNKLKKVFK